MNGINTVPVADDLTIAYSGAYTYSCLAGHKSNGTMTTICQADSTWSLQPSPECIRMYICIVSYICIVRLEFIDSVPY